MIPEFQGLVEVLLQTDGKSGYTFDSTDVVEGMMDLKVLRCYILCAVCSLKKFVNLMRR